MRNRKMSRSVVCAGECIVVMKCPKRKWSVQQLSAACRISGVIGRHLNAQDRAPGAEIAGCAPQHCFGGFGCFAPRGGAKYAFAACLFAGQIRQACRAIARRGAIRAAIGRGADAPRDSRVLRLARRYFRKCGEIQIS